MALLLVAALGGCKSTSQSCATIPLHLEWSEPAADDELVTVDVPTSAVPTGSAGDPIPTQKFPVPAGATQMDIPVDVSHFAFGMSLGITITHGNVIVMNGQTDPVRDCAPLRIGSWLVDEGVAPHD